MERFDWPASAWLKTANFHNRFSLLLAGQVGLAYHRLIGSSAHRLIGSSAHRAHGVSSGVHRPPHLHNLTSGLRPTIAHGFIGPPIPVSGSEGLTRSTPTPVTHDVVVTGARSAATPSQLFTPPRTDGADGPRPIPDGGSLPVEAQTLPPADTHTYARISATPVTA